MRCEKYSRILLGDVGPADAEKMAFKVLRAIFLFSKVFPLLVGSVLTRYVNKLLI